jgi:hypothetical protein
MKKRKPGILCRFKTADEFISEYGTDWTENVDWAPEMNGLLGKPITIAVRTWKRMMNDQDEDIRPRGFKFFINGSMLKLMELEITHKGDIFTADVREA